MGELLGREFVVPQAVPHVHASNGWQCSPPTHLPRLVGGCRYDFKAREYGHCELFEARRLMEPCSRVGAMPLLLPAATSCLCLLPRLLAAPLAWPSLSTANGTSPAHALTLLDCPFPQAVSLVLAEFTERAVNMKRRLLHTLLPFLPAARAYTRSLKVGCPLVCCTQSRRRSTLQQEFHSDPHTAVSPLHNPPLPSRRATAGGSACCATCVPPTWQRRRPRATCHCEPALPSCRSLMTCCCPRLRSTSSLG